MPMPVTSFALKITSASSPLDSNTTVLLRFHMFLPAFPIRWAWGPHSTIGRTMTQLIFLGIGSPGPRTGKIPSSGDTNQADLHSTEFPGQTAPLIWFYR